MASDGIKNPITIPIPIQNMVYPTIFRISAPFSLFYTICSSFFSDTSLRFFLSIFSFFFKIDIHILGCIFFHEFIPLPFCSCHLGWISASFHFYSHPTYSLHLSLSLSHQKLRPYRLFLR